MISNGQPYVLDIDDFYIYEKSNGLDELIFNISIYDKSYKAIEEEAIIEYEQPYLIKAIDAGTDSAKVKCQIDLDELKSTLNTQYNNNSDTLQNTILGVLPEGWILQDSSGISIRRTIDGAHTPYSVIMECPDTYGIAIRFDAKNRVVKTYNLSDFEPLGSFVSRDLNLKEINYKGKSSNFYTRLYAYGKDNLSFADINGGKPYVDCNTYTDKIICEYWQDDRYTVKENLLTDAQEMVNAAGVPERSYDCNVVDLASTNPELYGFENFKMFSVVKLIDDIKGIQTNYQVVERRRYPFYPEKNTVVLSSAPPKLQNTVQEIKKEITNTQSQLWKNINGAVSLATSLITGVRGGYVVINQNAQGQPFEILVMDQPSIETATKVWRWNKNGFGYSSNGYNGPYGTAITMDGSIVANFINAGQLTSITINNGNGTFTVSSDGAVTCSDISITGGSIHLTANISVDPAGYSESDLEKMKQLLYNPSTITQEDINKYDLDGNGTVDIEDVALVNNMLHTGNPYSYTNDVVINPLDTSIVISVGKTKIGRGGGYFEDLTASDMYIDRALWVKGENSYLPGVTKTLNIGDTTLVIIDGIIVNAY